MKQSARPAWVLLWVVSTLLFASVIETLEGQQPTTFRSRASLVHVDVLASDKQGRLDDLKSSDFEIRDNGVEQKVELFSVGSLPLKVILVFDASASIHDEELLQLRGASDRVLELLRREDRATLLTFGQRVVQPVPLTSDFIRLRSAFPGIVPGGRTALIDATYAALALADADAEPGRPLVIIFSDGIDTASWLAADAVIDAARRSDAVVYSVAASTRPAAGFLRSIGDATGGRVIPVDSAASADASFVEIAEEFKRRYVLGYSPEGVQTDGYHRIQVRVTRPGVSVRARQGYYVPSTPNRRQ